MFMCNLREIAKQMKSFPAKIIILVILICIWGISPAKARKTAQGQRHITAVIHIDAMPQYAAAVAGLLKDYRRETLKEKGIISCKVLQEAGRANHYSMVEEWADQAAYDIHTGTAAARQFREKVQPMLGAPVDERLHTEVE